MCQNAEKVILSIFKHFYTNAKSISLLHFIFKSFPYSSKWSLKPFSIVLVTLYYFSPTEIQIKSQMTHQLPFHWARLGWQLARTTCPDTGWELLLVLSCWCSLLPSSSKNIMELQSGHALLPPLCNIDI